MMKNKITPFQLFFLHFAAGLSGMTLFNVRGIVSVLLYGLFTMLWILCFSGCLRKTPTGFLRFFPFSRSGTRFAVALILTVPAAAGAARTWIAFFGSISPGISFLPPYFFLATVLGMAIFMAMRGLTTLGRLAELTSFLLVPLLLFRFSGHISLPNLEATVSVGEMLFRVGAAASGVLPVFLLSCAVAPGDAGISDAMQNVIDEPQDRSRFFVRIGIGATGTAALVRLLLTGIVLPFSDVLLLLFSWTSHLVRLALFFCAAFVLVRESVSAWQKSAVAATFSLSFAATVAIVLGFLGSHSIIPWIFFWMEQVPFLLMAGWELLRGTFRPHKLFLSRKKRHRVQS